MAVTNYYTVGGEIIGEHTAGQSRLDYVPDALGNVTSTINQSLTVESTARFMPYGASLASSGSGSEFAWIGTLGSRSTGRPHIEQYNRARHLSSVDGRWLSVDPQWPRESAFGYSAQNPTSAADSSGLQNPYCGPRNPYSGLFDPRGWQSWGEGLVKSVAGFPGRLYDSVAGFVEEHWPPCFPPTNRYQAADCFAEFLARIDRTGVVDYFVKFGYGNCCGLKRRCSGPNQGENGGKNCLDNACGEHDACLAGPMDYFNRNTQCSCNAKLCNAARTCNCAGASNRSECLNAAGLIIAFYCVVVPRALHCQ